MRGRAKVIIEYLQEQDPLKVWELTEHKEKRSLDSNAYFHVLANKLRMKMTPPWSMAKMKNHLITSYGQPEIGEDGQMIYLKANIPEESMCELESIHCLPVKYESDNVVFYRVYRGSHTLNSKEMNKLIEGTIDECVQVGIEVATPDELRRMAAVYARKNEGKSDK